MSRALLFLWLLWSANLTVAGEPSPPFETRATLELMGRFGAAHGCIIGEHGALTAAHVLDPFPDKPTALYDVRYEDYDHHAGMLIALVVWRDRDLGLGATSSDEEPFHNFNHRAASAPVIGASVWFQGYDYRKKKRALFPRYYRTQIVNIVADHLELERMPEHGDSGTCVYDDEGHVLAVVVGGFEIENQQTIGHVVGVWGERLKTNYGDAPTVDPQ